ncbi:MAG: hypothetical protein HOG89_02520 [Candidatus Peribacter sp.]|nr:hypothetical protein [Candidatus Peribacter sp.]MBT4392566.1 hypothetical protein [Candidatus Peribacter sp.]MBT4601421.1 hypothetical protein [Candidatus Peribacter sp.]MBT5149114.1 hypothetical protein [Candidatus Peribacter sp.]MBT5638111.1 hypothetical protein [Candidatus Peribacter sp.]
MRHRKSRNRLKQKPGHARMVKRNLLTSLLLYENVRTTKKRAAVIAPQVDKIINYAKTHKPHVAIRYINKTVTDKNASKKIMEVFIKRYAKKSSGLTRTKAAGFRVGDGASVVDISLVEGATVAAPAKEAKKEAPKKKPTPAKTPAK